MKNKITFGVAVLAALAMLALVPVPASAGAPTESVFFNVSIDCARESGPSGFAAIYFQVSGEVPEGLSGQLFVAYWAPGLDPDTDIPRYLFGSDASPAVTTTTDETSVTLDAELQEGETFLGVASLSAALAPSGPPDVFPFESDPGTSNQQVSGVSTSQALQGGANLVLPSGLGTFTFSSCAGTSFESVVSSTNPNASFFHIKPFTQVRCFWLDENGDETFLSGFASEEGASVSVGQNSFSTGEFLSGEAYEGVILTTETLQATVELAIVDGNGELIGTASATIDGSVILGNKQRSLAVAESQMEQLVFAPLRVEGTLALSTGQSFDLSACNGQRVFAFRDFSFQPSGPKPGGLVPVNDTVQGAIEIAPGTHLSTNTKGAALEAEEPVSCSVMRSTLWYRFRGTGGEVTLDTAGSGFDTVIGVYTQGPEGLTEVACVDDLFGPIEWTNVTQAALTLPTENGVTYYAQVGGFFSFSQPNEFGVLQLAMSG
jgi:hypothetical protein